MLIQHSTALLMRAACIPVDISTELNAHWKQAACACLRSFCNSRGPTIPCAHVDMHFHSFLLFYACSPPKQNQQPHAWVALFLNLFVLGCTRMHFGPARPLGTWNGTRSETLETDYGVFGYVTLLILWQLEHVWARRHARLSDACVWVWRRWSRRVQGASWKQCQPRVQRCPMGIKLGTALLCGSWDREWQNGLLSAAATSCLQKKRACLQ